ncbi:proton/sodium-glutamate symport protein GltT [Catenaria anguillulae PL171]|uniref:Amino acid transporter n=1 Tax=Catenaria anguillulae PL171 TaxID=765915 RepID=A0A1Y2HBS2_9FUNG|nr:proton/sodium-glutamate symport protein GltT [Catenaria anguillulae PL171]ORZ32026.1 proton/sodium-glutamate symport protein GltT [Catenaria anguillulae PL171]
MTASSPAPAVDVDAKEKGRMTPWRFLREKTSLSHYIFLATGLGLLIGGLGGKSVAYTGQVLAKIFLRAIKCLITPLIFSTLVVGIAGHGDDVGRVGRLFAKCLAYFWTVTTIALFIGLGAVNLIQPGVGVPLVKGDLSDDIKKNLSAISAEKLIEKVLPTSFFDAAATNETLGIVTCAVAFSIGLLWVPRQKRAIMIRWLDALMDIMFQVTWLVMLLAPLGIVGALMAVIGTNGFGVLVSLGKLVACLFGALLVLVIGVFVPVVALCRVNVIDFFRAIQKPAALAFFTASSESALPMAMEIMVEFGVPRDIVAFVMPTGYSFNLDGTTLYLAMASRFCAQIGEVEQDFGTQIIMMLTLMIVSKGVAAVPRASIVVLASCVTMFNLPKEGILVILGVDPFLDMARTCANLTGNCIATVVMARWEGRFGEKADDDLLVEDVEDVEKGIVVAH